MQKHDNDNIPVLEDIIQEHELLDPETPATNKKQKGLWDENGETTVATVTNEVPPDEYVQRDIAETDITKIDFEPPEEPVYARDDVSTGEIFIEPGDRTARESAALPGTGASSDIQGIANEAADSGFESPETGQDDDSSVMADQIASPDADETPHPPAGQIDIDLLADTILRQMLPDLEDYLLERIRSGLEQALDTKTRD